MSIGRHSRKGSQGILKARFRRDPSTGGEMAPASQRLLFHSNRTVVQRAEHQLIVADLVPGINR